MILIAPQGATERILQERALSLGVQIVRGEAVVGLRQDAGRVCLDLEDGRTEVAGYVVGSDGGEGAVIVVPFGDGWFRAIAWDRLREQVPLDVLLPVSEMRDAFVRIAGADFGMQELHPGCWTATRVSDTRGPPVDRASDACRPVRGRPAVRAGARRRILVPARRRRTCCPGRRPAGPSGPSGRTHRGCAAAGAARTRPDPAGRVRGLGRRPSTRGGGRGAGRSRGLVRARPD